MYKIQTYVSIEEIINETKYFYDDIQKLEYKIYRNKQRIAIEIFDYLCSLIKDIELTSLLTSVASLDKDSPLADKVFDSLLLIMAKNCDFYSDPETQDKNQKIEMSTFYPVKTADVLKCFSKEEIDLKFQEKQET